MTPRGAVMGQRLLARGRTLRAMILLLAARLLVAAVPFRVWRSYLGGTAGAPKAGDLLAARRLAAQVERAAWRLPLHSKCLPRAMALGWLLRRRRIGHRLIFAVRPPGHRGTGDDLHAWIEVGNVVVLGDLPGPWLRLLDHNG